jgi:hypothetical protein
MGEKDGVSNSFSQSRYQFQAGFGAMVCVCVSLSVHFLKLCVAYFKKEE